MVSNGVGYVTPQKNGNQKSNLMPEIPKKIKNGNQKGNLMPEIPKKIKNGNQKGNLMPETPKKIENGNQKGNLMPEIPKKIEIDVPQYGRLALFLTSFYTSGRLKRIPNPP